VILFWRLGQEEDTPLSRLSDMLCDYDPRFQEPLARVREAASLVLMVLAIWEVVRRLAVRLMEESLTVRAQQRETWPVCGRCRQWLQSKGFQPRTLHTLFGVIRWRRRVGRCPKGCKGVQVAPLDQALGLVPHQRTGVEVQWMGCLLAVFMPYETARRLLRQLTGVELAVGTLWRWVQQVGQRVRVQLEGELRALAVGKLPAVEPLAAELEALPLVIGADGVMVPFRPHPRTAKGKTRWREKVAILARLGARLSRQGTRVTQLCQRRLVAVLGTIDDLTPRLWLAAVRQGVRTAVRVVWLSDGGRGLWSVFQRRFQAVGVTAILDFYHAAQNLYKGASAWLDGRTRACQQWFADFRHRLRHGHEQHVLTELAALAEATHLPESARQTLLHVYTYLKTHEDHIRHDHFKTAGLPIGSGLVESACKWLIQQRFKGVGMRWSEAGFNHLLYLRLAWVNPRFDSFFPDRVPSPN
jgi:hypothetical protein